MNRREFIAFQILKQLEEDAIPLAELYLQAKVSARVSPRLLNSEFDEAVGICERAGWISGIRSGLKGVSWHLTDVGRAELNR